MASTISPAPAAVRTNEPSVKPSASATTPAANTILLSLGTRMLLATALLLAASFLICGTLGFFAARHHVRNEVTLKVSRDSAFLALASGPLMAQTDARARARLSELVQRLTQEPEILGAEILSAEGKVLAHALGAANRRSSFFSFQVPIHQDERLAGFVRVWYSPVVALEDMWATTGHLVLLLFIATFVLFALILFAVSDRMLNRPFREFMKQLDQSPDRLQPLPFNASRRDEWGLLGSRLNTYLKRVSNLQERSTVIYETSRLLTTPGALSSSIESVFMSLMHRYHLSSCMLFVMGERRLEVEAFAGVSQEFASQFSVQPGEGVAGVVYSSGLPRRVQRIAAEESDPLLKEMVQRQQAKSALFVPMKADGNVIGTAVYFARIADALSDADVESLSAFTDHAALAFRNGRRVSELQQNNQRLESELAITLRELTHTNSRLVQKVKELKTVYDLALATAASTHVEGIVRVMVSRIKDLVEVQGGAFFLYDPDSGLLEPLVPAFDRPASVSTLFACKVDESGILQRVIRTGQPELLNFVDASDALPASWKPLGIRSILALPLRQGDQVRGLFCVVNKLSGLFTEDDTRVLSLLTSRVAEVLHRLTLDEQLRQQVHDLRVLQDIGAKLPSPPVLTDTVAVIGRIARAALPGVDICLFFLHHPASEALVAMGGDWDIRMNFDLRSFTVGVSEKRAIAEVFREGQPAQFQRGTSDPLWQKDDMVHTFALEELTYFPLTVDHGTIGVMALGLRSGHELSFESRRLAGLVAKQVAIIIERSRLFEKLRSANEKLEQINHLKNEFISMVSHELRTPLTTIKGFVSIVLNEETGPLNDQQRRFLETSDRAIDRLTLLVSDLLDISRIEAGQIKMQLRPTPMGEVIHRVAASFMPQFKAQNLTLTVQVPDGLPLVLADPDRVSQVLDNLLSNALKFTSQGGVTITSVDKGDFVMTSVKDMGQGIPKEEQDKIFDKFYQIKAGNTYPGKGTGLGLAIVRSIVESHRGKVWVESEVGKGADFRFLLPRARTDLESQANSKIL